jgi:hypothetical protein
MPSLGFIRVSVRRSVLALVVAGAVMTVTPVRAALPTSGMDGGFEQEVEVGLEAGATIGTTLDEPAATDGGALGAVVVDGAAESAAVVDGAAGAAAVVGRVAAAVGDPVQGGPQDPGPGQLGNLGDLLGDDGPTDDPGTDLPGIPDGGGVPIDLTDNPLNHLPLLEPHPPVADPDGTAPGTRSATRPSVLPAGLSQPATGRIGVAPSLLAAPAPVASAQPVDPPSVAISRSPLARTGPGTLVQGPFALALLSASAAVRAAARRRPKLG